MLFGDPSGREQMKVILPTLSTETRYLNYQWAKLSSLGHACLMTDWESFVAFRRVLTFMHFEDDASTSSCAAYLKQEPPYRRDFSKSRKQTNCRSLAGIARFLWG